MDADAMIWLAAHLSWVVWALIVLWAPAVLYAVAIDLRLIAAPGSGYPTLRDPALVTGVLQVALMAAALPGLSVHRGRSWRLLAAAHVMWLAHFLYSVVSRTRLDGLRALRAPETLWPLGGLIAAALVLFGVRRYFQREDGAPALR
jgi:hypothetical protein